MSELIPVERAAEKAGITPARLRGFILRNGLTDPIGDLHQVHDDWRLERLRPAEDFSDAQ